MLTEGRFHHLEAATRGGCERSYQRPNGLATLAALAITASVLLAPPVLAEPRNMVLRQITSISMGDIQWPRVRMQDGSKIVFVSDGDVLGTGTATAMRQVYLWDETSGTITQVTNGVDCESYDASRPTDDVFAGGRPEVVAFVSTCDLDPTRGNSDGNPEIFLWETASGRFHQMTNTVAPVVNGDPFASDSGRCLVFRSSGDLGTNVPSNPYFDADHPGPGFTNADGSDEVFLYGKIDGDGAYPHNAVFTQISNGPAGTTSSRPVIGGYWFARQCQTSAYQSDHDQLGTGLQGQHVFMYRMPASAVEEMASPREIPKGLPPGVYAKPHISSASPFARGPFIVFETGPDLWNNGSLGNDAFRYRVFHPRMTQYTDVGSDPDGEGPASPGEVRRPVISDGGGVIAFDSTTEHVNQRRPARIGGSPPFNADGNPEVFRLKGRRRVWQITRSQGCESTQASVRDDGRRIVFRSTCDLIPGLNPTGSPQVFMFSLEKNNSDVLSACTDPQGLDGCCSHKSGCYEPVFGKQPARPPRPNCLDRGRC